MNTLGRILERVSDRLAETSEVFWTAGSRTDAVNDAQRFISTLTKGVEVSHPIVGQALSFPHAVAGIRNSYGELNGRRLPGVIVDEANLIDPDWITYIGPARWMVVDDRANVVYLTPLPDPTTSWTAKLRVVPPDLINESDEIFLGEPSMIKFLGPVINLACAYLLLQERFDGDAERFYQFALQELVQLGVDSPSIPPLQNAGQGG